MISPKITPDGGAIKRLLKEAGFGSHDLASRAQCTNGTVELAKQGQPIDVEELKRIAIALGTTPDLITSETREEAGPAFWPGQVFISHSKHDCAFVESIILPFLDHNHVFTWYAPRDIQPGEDWTKSIEKALLKCDRVAAILSPDALKSKYVREEILWALEHKPEGAVIPVFVEACDPASLFFGLNRLQRVDLHQGRKAGSRSRETGLKRLLAALCPAPPTSDPTDESDGRDHGGRAGDRSPEKYPVSLPGVPAPPTRPDEHDELPDATRVESKLTPSAIAWSGSRSRACLIRVHPRGAGLGRRYDLGDQPTTLGRDADSTIYLPEERTSRRHARIEQTDTGYFLVDDGSRNGTFLNTNRVGSPQQLRNGDLIRIGEAQFRVIIDHNLDDACAELRRVLVTADPLIGCDDREAWREDLARELVRSHDHGRPLGVVLVGVDRLTQIGERYGPDAEGAAIREIALRLKGQIREYDSFTLWDRDAFAVAKLETTPEAVLEFAEQVRHEVGRGPVAWEGQPYHLTASAGVACAPGGTWVEADSLLVEAHRSIREAMRRGGNRVVGPRGPR